MGYNSRKDERSQYTTYIVNCFGFTLQSKSTCIMNDSSFFAQDKMSDCNV